MLRPLVLVLGDQLSLDLPTLVDLPEGGVVAMCEVAAESRYVAHHPQKIALFLAADGTSIMTTASRCRKTLAFPLPPGMRVMPSPGRS